MNGSSFEEFLASYTPEVRDLALRTRALILEAIPDAVEVVDPPSKIIAYGFGRKYADLVCAIAPYKSYVNLIFSRGVELPDPCGQLSGTGKRARHVKIQSPADIDPPGVRALLGAAVGLMQPKTR
jgi:hypothetical protein